MQLKEHELLIQLFCDQNKISSTLESPTSMWYFACKDHPSEYFQIHIYFSQ